ncbi:MAG: hypothetical protein ABT00_19595 [Bordetella sp. SCN 68-11]|nr:MAG: hypothetical protein ABT00_19595 [Bordetella sp. SCN 68-11]
MLRILAIIAPSTAASTSASSSTRNGALPPSSMGVFRTWSAAAFSRMRPTSVDPVKDTSRTRGSCSQRSTSGPERDVGTMLTTPSGTPASARMSASASMLSGVSEAGLTSTVQPAASAGAILRAPMAEGKFQGVTSATTPMGWCWTRIR